jgi:hypothetical protein
MNSLVRKENISHGWTSSLIQLCCEPHVSSTESGYNILHSMAGVFSKFYTVYVIQLVYRLPLYPWVKGDPDLSNMHLHHHHTPVHLNDEWHGSYRSSIDWFLRYLTALIQLLRLYILVASNKTQDGYETKDNKDSGWGSPGLFEHEHGACTETICLMPG